MELQQQTLVQSRVGRNIQNPSKSDPPGVIQSVPSFQQTVTKHQNASVFHQLTTADPVSDFFNTHVASQAFLYIY